MMVQRALADHYIRVYRAGPRNRALSTHSNSAQALIEANSK